MELTVPCLGLLLPNAFPSWAQLPDGSIAPDFTATDIYGVEYNFYSYLGVSGVWWSDHPSGTAWEGGSWTAGLPEKSDGDFHLPTQI